MKRLTNPVRPDHLDKLGSKRPGLNSGGPARRSFSEACVEGLSFLSFFITLLFSLIFCLPAYARVTAIKSTPHLLQKLSSAPYSVVVFYNNERSALRNLGLKQFVLDMQIMMRSISDDPLYKNADLQFLLIDISRASTLSALRMFKIKQLPATLIFIGRQPVEQRLTGFVDRAQITQAINQNLETQMQERMKQKEYQLKQDVEKAKIRSFDQAYMWGTYWAPYWNWGYAPFWEPGWRPYDRWYYY